MLRLNKILNSQDEAACLWYEKLLNGLLGQGFVASKVGPYLLMSNTVISVVFIDDFIFWACSQYGIGNVMKSFKEDGPSYNWEHSKVDLVSELLCIGIKTLDDGIFHFCKTGLIHKLLKATGMDHYNRLTIPTKVEAPLGRY